MHDKYTTNYISNSTLLHANGNISNQNIKKNHAFNKLFNNQFLICINKSHNNLVFLLPIMVNNASLTLSILGTLKHDVRSDLDIKGYTWLTYM